MGDDASSGDAMTHGDAAADAAADAGDGETCGVLPAQHCFGICDIWSECPAFDSACAMLAGWCGSRAVERSGPTMEAVYNCMLSHVDIQPGNTTVDCVAVPTCWDSVPMCL